jgi:hypothetical protein
MQRSSNQRGRSPTKQPHQTNLPVFQAPKPEKISWFNGNQKQDLIDKNKTNETSFKTINYDTFYDMKPKQEHP